ncbi:ISL3 family transposase [Staphylococcus sp. IVB6181]|uniref:ISL3 family transposase n=1 Tax=Staphylococcus sp. IVB6181 TaxID=2929481 RepID=UPI0021D315F4|nr:ISL3 family transposase [Staphylococcus sp. IVB6181]UXV36181.1 ISL3 family transposase [Staphylococcus sp. IVB6181]
MCNDTLEILRIKDKNIKFVSQDIDVIVKGKKSTVVNAVLTYKPSACPCCGIKNEGQIHKHGKRVSRITLLKTQGYNTYLNLAKQRFKCLECNTTFTAETDVVDKTRFISNYVNQKIIEEATKVKTEIDTAEDNCVSPSTVRRIRNKAVNTLLIKPFDNLPEHLAMDEFRSVKSVTGLMSFIFINNDTHEFLDVLENRTSGYLKAYFERFDRKNRLKVKTITIDMFEPYLFLFKKLFFNASIIFDRFHIVQHMNRELNFYRREVMNRYKDKEGREYPVLKNKWRLLLTDKRKLFMMDGIWDGSFRCYKKGYDLVNFMLQTDEKLKNSYELVHDLRESLKLCNWKDFINRLNDVDKNSISKNIWKVVTFFRKHQEILRNTIYNPLLNNGAIEGINNKRKLIKRISYGYRSFNNLRNRIMLVFSLFKNKKKKTTRPVHRMVV